MRHTNVAQRRRMRKPLHEGRHPRSSWSQVYRNAAAFEAQVRLHRTSFFVANIVASLLTSDISPQTHKPYTGNSALLSVLIFRSCLQSFSPHRPEDLRILTVLQLNEYSRIEISYLYTISSCCIILLREVRRYGSDGGWEKKVGGFRFIRSSVRET